MSSIPAINRAAAESIAAGNEPMVQALMTGMKLTHILQVYTSSMVAVAVWDWLSSLEMEYRYIWKKEWSIIKGLYLWTRYYGLACFSVNLWLFNDNFTKERCATLHYLIAATSMWSLLGSEAILAIRTYAFLGKKMWIGIMLVIMLLGETGFLLYVSIAGVHQIDPFPIGDMKGPCTAADKPGRTIVTGFWLAPVAFDIVCTILTMWQAFRMQQILKTSRIVKIFVREGLLYFLAVTGVNLLNAAFMFQSNPNLQNLNSYLALVLSQVLCCRLVLNLKGVQEPASNFTSSEHSYATNARSAGVSIPLRSFNKDLTNANYTQHDIYEGVKVQIDVERHNNQSTDERRSSSEIQNEKTGASSSYHTRVPHAV